MVARVSVIIRTRDRKILLERALSSLASQTLSDFQLIVVNDGGEPGPVQQAVDEAGLSERASIIHNESSVGREHAVNVGAEAAHAPYLAILDDDDSWAPDFLTRTVDYLDHSNDGAVAVRTEVIYEKIKNERVIEQGREILKPDSRRISLTDILVVNWVPPTSMVVRRDVFEQLDGWDGSISVQADWDFMLRLLLASSVGFIDGEPLAFWHRRDQDGVLGNSVHALADEHREINLLIRDRYLRDQFVEGDSAHSRGGLGSLLFLAELTRRGIDHESEARQAVLGRIDEQAHQVIRRSDLMGEQLTAINEHLGHVNEYLAQFNELLTSIDARLNNLEHIEQRRLSHRMLRSAGRVRARTKTILSKED